MNSITPSTPSYSFRTSTAKNTESCKEKNKKPLKKARRILTLEETASLISGNNHDCTIVNPEHTKLKAQNRMIYAYVRMTISRAWECKTTRGPTQLQGYSSTCGNCQSAHWALTPNLCDNKLPLVVEEIKSKGVYPPSASPGKIKYLKNTLRLSDTELDELQRRHGEKEFIDTFFKSKVTREQWEHSFQGTALEKNHNGTIEGSTDGNQVDSRLEASMRKEEDNFCALVEAKQIHPKDGIRMLAEKMINYYCASLENLTIRYEQLDKFKNAENDVSQFEDKYNADSNASDIPDEEFETHINNLTTMLELRKELKSSLIGAPRYKKVDNHRRDYYTLFAIVTNFKKVKDAGDSLDIAKKFYLESFPKFKRYQVDMTKTLEKIQKCTEEIVFQQQGTAFFTESDNIETLDSLIFGVYDAETKVRNSVTTPEKKGQLYELTAKEPVNNESKKRRRLEFEEM